MPDGVFQQHAVRFFVNTKNKYLMITAKPLGISETASDRVSAAAGIGACTPAEGSLPTLTLSFGAKCNIFRHSNNAFLN